MGNKMIRVYSIAMIGSLLLSHSAYSDANSDYNTSYSKAQTLIQEKKFTDAILIMEPLAKTHPTFDLYLSMGDAQASLDSPSKAMEYYQLSYKKALELNNNVYTRIALFKIARTYLWLKDTPNAIVTYNQLIASQLGPEDLKTAQAGLYTAKQMQMDDLIAQASQLIEQNKGQEAFNLVQGKLDSSNNFFLYKIAGQSMATMNNPKQAIIYFEKALAIAPNEETKTFASAQIAKMKQWLSAPDDNQIVLHSEIPVIPPSPEDQLVKKSRELLQANKPQEAYDSLKEELPKSTNAALFINAAKAMAILEKPKPALEYYQKALSLSDNNQDKIVALFGMIKMQIWLNEPTATKKSIEQLKQIKLTPSDSSLLSRLTQKLYGSKSYKQKNIIRPPTLIDKIISFISHENPQAAIELLSNYQGPKNYLYYITTARALALMELPRQALDYYKEAYKKAQNSEEQKAALFGIGTIDLWLELYEDSRRVFKQLLSMPLTPDEKERATQGLVTSLSYQDYPMLAFSYISESTVFKYPRSVLAAARAAAFADWGYKAKIIFLNNREVISKIPPKSALGKELKEINWLVLRETAKATLGITNFFQRDTDDFVIDRRGANASYRFFGINSNTLFSLRNNIYRQPMIETKVNVAYLGQSFINIMDTINVDFAGSINEVDYINTQESKWNPFLWEGNLGYKPNDYWRFGLHNDEEYVESLPALQNHILMNNTEGSFAFHPFPRMIYQAALFHNEFNDSNIRNGGTTSLGYLLSRPFGVSGILRARGYTNTIPRSPNYFSPKRYKDYSYGLIVKRKLSSTWRAYAEGALGQQIILNTSESDQVKQRIYNYNFGIEGELLKNLQLILFYGYSQSAFTNANGYARRYTGGELKLFVD